MKRSKFTEEQIAFALHQLEEENRKLKQLVADLSLDKVMLQDVLRKKL
jgi:putative transposase